MRCLSAIVDHSLPVPAQMGSRTGATPRHNRLQQNVPRNLPVNRLPVTPAIFAGDDRAA